MRMVRQAVLFHPSSKREKNKNIKQFISECQRQKYIKAEDTKIDTEFVFLMPGQRKGR